MKTKYLFIAGLVIGFSSCSTAYRMGQTPDDVYYSPAPAQEEYVTINNQQEKDSYGYNNQSDGENFAIRRGITNPVYRNYNSLNFGYGYDPYGYNPSLYGYNSSLYGYNSSLYSPYSYLNSYGHTGVSFYPYNYYSSYNPFNNYGNYYSPYDFYAPVYYNLKPGNAESNYSGPRRYSLGAYDRTANNDSRYVTPATNTNSSVPVRTFTPPAPTNTTGVGSFIRRVFTPNNNNNNNNNTERNTRINNNRNTENNINDRPARSFQPSPGNNNSSSSPSGSSSAPVRTFRK